jgi:hypothetical protein
MCCDEQTHFRGKILAVATQEERKNSAARAELVRRIGWYREMRTLILDHRASEAIRESIAEMEARIAAIDQSS